MLSSDHDDRCDLDAAATAYAEDRTRSGPAGRRALRDDLIRRGLPLADRLARGHQDRPEPLDDLEQVARLGLIKAVDQYDPAHGSFTAFAVITVCAELKRHFPDRTRVPATAAVAVLPGTRVPMLAGETMDGLPDRLAVTELVRMLPHRIQRIIAWHFYGNQSQARIAEQLGISQMQVSRLMQQALTWLRTAMLSDAPPPWTGQDDTHGPDSLRIDIRQGDTALIARVRGELDRDTADRLRHRLHAAVSLAAPGPLVVDLTGVPLVDAAGAAVLRDAFMAGSLSGVEVTFTGLQPHVTMVLTVLGLTTRTGNAGASHDRR
ncbi:sigma-70 family RNA polymerase sigma factor [Actinoplanes sp. CA-051413]|uniref:sigma-70 family RNA polymerase sigma factor n=1 Tax=Actinoplanes sp. CA-051413 TaxID=3239899 RepID=UPI003D9834F1